MKTYRELLNYKTFEDRFEYLKLEGFVGDQTFGCKRYINQKFYHSKEWRDFRNYILLRDNGNDLGIAGRPIPFGFTVHHINPITEYDIVNNPRVILDPNNAILVSEETHKALHYGSIDSCVKDYIPRREGDTTLWKIIT